MTAVSPGRARDKGPARRLIDPLLRGVIVVQAAWVDSRFVRRQGLTPTLAGRVLSYPSVAWERLRRGAATERQELLFERYSKLNQVHYGPTGRGYQEVATGDPAERRRRYADQHSRLEHFVEEFPDVLHYSDGDSFLDLGCGTGQNIRMLAARFPTSRIRGFDLNADAVALVQECEDHPGVIVEQGDLTDRDFRREALSEPADHIVLSHVFSLLMGASRDDTVALRQGIVADLVAACRKDVVIVDSFGPPGPPVIAIEQRQRATLSDDVLGYFSGHHDGRAFLVQSDRTRAVIFVKSRPDRNGD